jgi:hypothetical protein
MATLQVVRNSLGQAIKSIDMVHSPDDGGWYFHEFDFVKRRDRVGKGIFPSADAARRAFAQKTLKWEAWQ